MRQVTPNVYVETETPGCNYGFVVTSDGVVIIDSPQRPSDAVRWREEAAKKGPIRYVVNTEHHGDHVTGNFFFPGTVVSHQISRELFGLGPIEQLRDRIKDMDPEGLSLMEGYQAKPAAITYSERMSIYLGEHTFELIHAPGHTPGQTAVYVPQEEMLFTGDNVVNKVEPFFMQALPLKWVDSLERLAQLDVQAILPGHGEVCDKSAIAEISALIKSRIETVREAIREGMSKEEAVEKIDFGSPYTYGPGLEARTREMQRMCITKLYDELTR